MNLPYSLREIDTSDPTIVASEIAKIEAEVFPRECNAELIYALFEQVDSMFKGKFTYFQAMDTVYHNLEHTLQATLCWARIFRNYQKYGGHPTISPKYFRIGLVAVLLHDVGYLKEEHDEYGTGAKFTFVHERRSCELAHICLNANGWPSRDIFAVQHIISCTGPRAVIDAIPFRHRSEHLLGRMVCTADYLGQMSDPNYVRKLPVLFEEFEESDNYRGIPRERRMFNSVEELITKTPEFWYGHVLPKLENDCGGFYRLLSEPYPDGTNPYIVEVERNLAKIRALMF